MALTDKLTDIADAIRGKTGKTEEMTLDQMPLEIASIVSGGSGGGGIQSASGTYVLTEDAVSISIDINDIGFIPDLAFVTLDETDFTYTSAPTKIWALLNIPFLREHCGIQPYQTLGFSNTNCGFLYRGAQGTNTFQVAAPASNFVGYPKSAGTNIRINLTRSAASYPIIAGTYKWECHKVWEDE